MALHSKLTVVKLDTSGGVLTDISTYCKKFSINRKLDMEDVTTFGSTDKKWLLGFADADISLSGPWTRTSDQFFSPIVAAFKAGTIDSISFEYGPEGADSGDVKYLGEMILSDYDADSDIGSPIEWSAKGKVTGGVTVTTY